MTTPKISANSIFSRHIRHSYHLIVIITIAYVLLLNECSERFTHSEPQKSPLTRTLGDFLVVSEA